jgi:hypothetical protein
MKRDRRSHTTADIVFRESVEAAEHLQFVPGLGAIRRGEGRRQISGENSHHILGSVYLDGDCRMVYPSSKRWDYVIGYSRSRKPVAHFVEVHSAETSEVSTMERKLEWLAQYLARGRQERLARLPREYHWVASGRIRIPQHTPQFKHLTTSLRRLGLRGPVRTLVLT